jgi:hypothetical protein
MAPKKQKAEVKQAVKQAASGGVTKQELQQIAKQTGATSQQIVQQMDIINKNVKQAGGEPSIALNSGAANMLIKQAKDQTGYDAYLNALTGRSAFGSGQIGKTLQSMIGSPGMFGEAATPGTGMMAGGGTIRPGGRITYNPEAFFNRVGSIGTGGAGPYNAGNMPMNTGTNDVGPLAPGTTGGSTTGGDMIGGDQFDYQSILDAIAGIQQPQFDMSALTDMFNTQFDQLRSEFATRDPIQLAQLGRAYGGDAIRARQRNRRSSRDYRRGMTNSAFGPATANLAIGGGLTL